MSLRDWLRHSWLVAHQTSPEEITALLAIVERDLSNSKVAGLSADWQLNIGYNAALQAATVALAAAGYRAAREQHHYRTIQKSRVYDGRLPKWIDSTAFVRSATSAI